MEVWMELLFREEGRKTVWFAINGGRAMSSIEKRNAIEKDLFISGLILPDSIILMGEVWTQAFRHTL